MHQQNSGLQHVMVHHNVDVDTLTAGRKREGACAAKGGGEDLKLVLYAF